MKRVTIRIQIDDIEDEDAIVIKREIDEVIRLVPEATIDFSIRTVPDRPA